MNREYEVLLSLSGDAIAYRKVFTEISGSVTCGVLLSQLLYWSNKVKGRQFYKTNEGFCEEIGLSAKEFKLAKTKLLNKGFISVEHKSMPRRTYYQVNIENIINALTDNWEKSPTSQYERDQLDGPKGTDCMVRKGPTTSETTTETTTYIDKSVKKTKVTLELEEFVSTYNATYQRNISVPSGDKGWVKNFKKWREDYSLEQIKEAVVLSRNHPFYKDKLTPDMLFRLNEDRISLFLNTPKPKTREQLETEEFERIFNNARG
jgi:hypothetical protein